MQVPSLLVGLLRNPTVLLRVRILACGERYVDTGAGRTSG
jgi:hypothetical protein